MKCTNHPDRDAAWTDSIVDTLKKGANLGEPGYTRKCFCDECAAIRRRDCGNTARLQRVCQNDPNEAEYKFINGEENSFVCSVCLQDILLDIVTSNQTACFRYEAWKLIQEEHKVKAFVTVFDPFEFMDL